MDHRGGVDGSRQGVVGASNARAEFRSSFEIMPVEIDSPNWSLTSCWIGRWLRRY
ncbi:MAG: hypothetical protein JO161_03850 [Planctomycetaceae bacterium]|nr:hypothetical protein [Planctomycetaceae bacterium]